MKKTVIYLGLLALVVAIGMSLSGCGQEEKKELEIDPPGVENILYENVITETILYEDVTTYWE